MPDIAELLGYIIYITSHDQNEPLHVHVISPEYFGIKAVASKIWIGKNGSTKIATKGSDISDSKLRKIAQIIKNDPEIFSLIKQAWCSLFQISEQEIEFYRNVNEQTQGLKR